MAAAPLHHIAFSREDKSIIGRWWWTVDRWTLSAIILLMSIGAFLTLSASPPVAERIHLPLFYFVYRQFIFLSVGLVILLLLSLCSPKWIRRIGVIGFLIMIPLLISTLFMGTQIKGSSRWISLGLFSIQPSEFIKPFFAIFSAWMFSESRSDQSFPGQSICIGGLILVIMPLILQPDIGQTILITGAWLAQFFVAGLHIYWIILMIILFCSIPLASYFLLPHVRNRIDDFFRGDGYQIEQSIHAFRNGGLFGKGPGQGFLKSTLPDAHSDFIFSVAGEEFGAILCLCIISLFAFITLRGLYQVSKKNNLFIMLVVIGLLVQFSFQASINMASALELIPPKGMTLPFISYGGSSTIALSFGLGAVLSLTRKGSEKGV